MRKKSSNIDDTCLFSLSRAIRAKSPLESDSSRVEHVGGTTRQRHVGASSTIPSALLIAQCLNVRKAS